MLGFWLLPGYWGSELRISLSYLPKPLETFLFEFFLWSAEVQRVFASSKMQSLPHSCKDPAGLCFVGALPPFAASDQEFRTLE